MMPCSQRRTLFLLLCLGAPSFASAAGPGHPCASVVDPGARLACYDKAFPPPAEVHQAAARKGADDFGLEGSIARRNQARSSEAADPDSIAARVVQVDYGGGRRRIVLDNGQAWMLAESASAGPLRQGDDVRIRKGLMGGYLLTTPAGVSLRVRRTR